MPLKRDSERNSNQSTSDQEAEAADIKKHHDATKTDRDEEDEELCQKKDRPPRFSTLFGATPAPVVVEGDLPPRRKSGVFVPTSVFVVLIIILLLESTFLFAYTVIGLYNNLPSGLLSVAGASPAPINTCDCAERPQPAINFSPNFYLPDAHAEDPKAVIAGAPTHNGVLPVSKSLPSSSSTSKSASSTKTSSTSTKIVTFTPPPKIVHSTALVTINPAGSTLTSSTTKSPSTPTPFTNPNASKASNRARVDSESSSSSVTRTTRTKQSSTTTKAHASAKPTKSSEKDNAPTSAHSTS